MDSGSLPINGGGIVSIDELHYPHDFIELRVKTKARIYEKCAPLYENGLSIRDISAHTGIPKTTVRETLVKSGMTLRNPMNGNASKIDSKRTKRGGNTPYGFTYLDGQLVIDPREHLVVRQIMKLNQDGKSGQTIADELNRQKIPTRRRGIWRKCVVHSIIRQQKEDKQKTGGSNE